MAARVAPWPRVLGCRRGLVRLSYGSKRVVQGFHLGCCKGLFRVIPLYLSAPVKTAVRLRHATQDLSSIGISEQTTGIPLEPWA